MKAIPSLACLMVLFGLAGNAFAEYHELTEPSIAFPGGFPESARTNILARLRRTDCKFISGAELNASTSLKYGGDTVALNNFMKGLATCPGVTLSVRFFDRADDDGWDWMAAHYAYQPGDFVVHMNLKSTRIKLDALAIPEIKGPNLPQTR
jgi:hypothetical protein